MATNYPTLRAFKRERKKGGEASKRAVPLNKCPRRKKVERKLEGKLGTGGRLNRTSRFPSTLDEIHIPFNFSQNGEPRRDIRTFIDDDYF